MQAVHRQLNRNIRESDPNFKNEFASILCYGSYKLGVSGPNGDVDCLVLAPKYVKRDEHFFGILFGMLNDMAKTNKKIEDLTCVNEKNSITPLITMTFYGVDMDLVFATLERVDSLNGTIDRLGLSDRPNLGNNDILEHMDGKMLKSYNGFRNAEMMLNAVIHGMDRSRLDLIETRINTFRNALRCVKQIGKLQGIAENKLGYLGGIAFGILTIKIV